VEDIIMPPIGKLLGPVNFSDLYLNLSGETYKSVADAKAHGAATINYGLFLNTVVNFLIVALVIFLVVQQANRWTKKPAAPTTKDCPQCAMTIPIAAKRCGHCTSQLA
jgi:large conductance mechanosensitive channel